jgi:cob(I)alamin adenosyltransferase
MHKKSNQKYGMLHVYTGNGKGKTSIAIGTAIRAIGAGMKVAWIAFDKGGNNDHYSERKVLENIGVDFIATGLRRIDSKGEFRFGTTEEDKKEGQKATQILRNKLSDNFDIFILDELCTSLHLEILEDKAIQDILYKRPKNKEIICTGRYAPHWILEAADLITELKENKHYFSQNISARRGIDY